MSQCIEHSKIHSFADDKIIQQSINTIDDVRNRLQTENSNVFSSVNKIIKNKFKKFGKKGNILNTPFDIPVTNFYLNDVISKSSKIMRKCADKINNGDRKYNEYTNTF